MQPIKITGNGIAGPVTFEKQYLDVRGKSGLTFSNVTLSNCGQVQAKESRRITFYRCKFLDLLPSNEKCIQLWPGCDDWIFDECEFVHMGDAIYSNYFKDRLDVDGAQRVTVKNCIGKYIGTTKEHPSRDGHFVGLQGGSGHVISGNMGQRTGTALEFWARRNMPMLNCRVEGNNFSRCRALANEDGSGIKFSGDAGAAKGLRTGTICRNNRISYCAGYGISSNWPDEIAGLSTNQIKECKKGNLRITGL